MVSSFQSCLQHPISLGVSGSLRHLQKCPWKGSREVYLCLKYVASPKMAWMMKEESVQVTSRWWKTERRLMYSSFSTMSPLAACCSANLARQAQKPTSSLLAASGVAGSWWRSRAWQIFPVLLVQVKKHRAVVSRPALEIQRQPFPGMQWEVWGLPPAPF